MNYTQMCKFMHDSNQNIANIKLLSSVMIKKIDMNMVDLQEFRRNLTAIQYTCSYYFHCANNLRDHAYYLENPPKASCSSMILDEYIKVFIASITPVIEHRGVDFSTRFSDCENAFVCDYEKLSHILNNFISNAVKYNDKEDKKVIFSVFKKDGRMYFSVQDNGMGIPKDEIDKITEPSYRASNVRNVVTAGCGLGLNIVKSLTEAMDAELIVTSELGKGSKFTVAVPEGKVTGLQSAGGTIEALEQENIELAFSDLYFPSL